MLAHLKCSRYFSRHNPLLFIQKWKQTNVWEPERHQFAFSSLQSTYSTMCQQNIPILRKRRHFARISVCFQKNRSTNDMVFTARLLQYSCMDKNIPLYLAFIDIAKAYDSVHRPTLWKILQTIGIPPKLLALLKTLYGENNCRVKFCNKFSKSLKLLEGLKQGCPAACILFNIFFSIVIFVLR